MADDPTPPAFIGLITDPNAYLKQFIPPRVAPIAVSADEPTPDDEPTDERTR